MQDDIQSMPLTDSFKEVVKRRRDTAAITDRAKELVKKHYRTPDALVAYIESQGTPVFVLPADWISRMVFNAFGVDVGFIPHPEEPKQRKKLERLVGLLNIREKKLGCRLENGIIIVPHDLYTASFLAHQLHHWLAFQAGLPGYTDEAKRQYQRYWNEGCRKLTTEILNMSVEEIKHLRDAVNRDLEALKFIQQVTEEIFMPGITEAKPFPV